MSKIDNRSAWKIQLHRWLYWCAAVSVGFFFLVLAGYLIAINALATKGYALKDVEKRVSDLTREQKHLHIEQAQLTSLYRVRQESDTAGLVDSDEYEVVYALHHFALRE